MIDKIGESSGSDYGFDLTNLLSADFQQLSNTLSKGVFAGYLLGYDYAQTECQSIIDSAGFHLAEGDDKKKKLVKRVPRWRIKDYDPNEKTDVAAEITNDSSAAFGLRFDVPPQEAIDFFAGKKILTADEFAKLSGEAKRGAFAIAKVNEVHMTEALRNELADALRNGTPQRDVIKRLKDILEGAGHKVLGTGHLETVFRTSTQMAYGVGRRKAQEDVVEYLPVWEYSDVGDDRTRPTHRALEGLQYPANHPFWDKYYPPWDFLCRCLVIPTFAFRTGYDRTRPNDQSVLEYDREGLPTSGNVDGIPVNLKGSNFVGVPRQTSLEEVLKTSAKRALDRKNKEAGN